MNMETPTVPKLPKIAPIQFIKEVRSELVKVDWPSRQETYKLTVVVITISVVVAVFIGGFDALFLKLSTLLWR